MSGLNLAKFKKVADDGKSVTMQHPEGHKITLAKSSLSALHKKQIERMPTYRPEGGAMGDAPNQLAAPTPQPSGTVGPAPMAEDESNVSRAPAAAPDNNAQATQANPQTSGVDLNAAYRQGQRAITEQQGVAEQLAQATAEATQKDMDARRQLQDTQQQYLSDFTNHHNQLMQDYAAGHIDPKHYVENMGTGQKVATAIGLLLGGFSATRKLE